jgi:cystathionine beta-lyase
VGRVWAEDELLELASILSKHEDVFVFDDELWADFTYAPNKHHPLLQLAPHLAKRTITATRASKTFNLAGLENTNLIVPDENIKSKFNDAMFSLALNKTNLFAIVATKAAYKYGEGWVDQLLEYLHENFEFMKNFLNSRIPSLDLVEPEGTYLAWVNTSRLGVSSSEVADKLLRIGHVAVEDGSTFGPGGEGFLRVNYAMPRSLLQEALEGFKKALSSF